MVQSGTADSAESQPSSRKSTDDSLRRSVSVRKMTDFDGMRRLDRLRLSNNGVFLKAFNDCANEVEKSAADSGRAVIFSDIVQKVNRKGVKQQRVLVLTPGAIYNFKPPKFHLKRRIALSALASVSISPERNEVALHVKHDYDYLIVIHDAAAFGVLLESVNVTVIIVADEERGLEHLVVRKATSAKSLKKNLYHVNPEASAEH